MSAAGNDGLSLFMTGLLKMKMTGLKISAGHPRYVPWASIRYPHIPRLVGDF